MLSKEFTKKTEESSSRCITAMHPLMRRSLLSFEIEIIIFNLSFVVIDARVYEILLQR
jgi:hypothetical protein